MYRREERREAEEEEGGKEKGRASLYKMSLYDDISARVSLFYFKDITFSSM